MPNKPATCFNIYNTENQSLDANMLSKLLQFCSDNFAGAVSATNPIVLNQTKKTWSWEGFFKDREFIGGGINLDYISCPVTAYDTSSNNDLWCIEVNLNPENKNIITEETTDIGVEKYSCTSINKEDVVVDSVVVGTRYTIVYNEETYTYYYNTIWINESQFIIPICANINGTLEQLLSYRDKASLESFLSAQAYAKLKAYMDATFVWRIGGTDKGNVGKLNFTDDILSSTDSANDSLKIDPKNIFVRNIPKDPASCKAVVRDENSKIYESTALPVSAGGTGAVNRAAAKTNLGMFYGTQEPAVGAPGAVVGDIYFKILEE